MFIILVGLNHQTAPVEIRERVNFSGKALMAGLKEAHALEGVEGVAILCTCNRTEVYAVVRESDKGYQAVTGFLAAKGRLEPRQIRSHLYFDSGEEAVGHLFRVAAGLDSMILGESQILGQVREAYQAAAETGVSNGVLNTLFLQAITVGKQVRTYTEIDRNAVSISYAAVELAKQVFGTLTARSVLLIGAGEMSELTAKHLVSHGVSAVTVSNRSFDRAVNLAGEFGGKAVRFDDLFAEMELADIVISCTSAPHCIVRYPEMERVMARRSGKTIFLIDIAVPRDIDPEVRRLGGVHLYDIDALQNVVDENLKERQQEAIKAEKMVAAEIKEYMAWLHTRFVIPTVVALRDKGEAIKTAELKRALNRLGPLTPREEKVIGSMANSIVKQLLHDPILRLKEFATTDKGVLYTRVLSDMFNLGGKAGPGADELSMPRQLEPEGAGEKPAAESAAE